MCGLRISGYECTDGHKNLFENEIPTNVNINLKSSEKLIRGQVASAPRQFSHREAFQYDWTNIKLDVDGWEPKTKLSSSLIKIF